MALSSNTNWDVRPGVGSDTNGGAFVAGASGTDYSQQTSPQWALSGIASAGAGNTVLSASAAATMVGNIANVVSGSNFTTGPFQIVSVVAGVSITFATNGASASICTGVGSAGVINIGGSLNTISAANTNAIAGNNIYVKGTYTATAALNLTLVNGQPITFIGYTTTHGDNGQATWTTVTNSINLIEAGAGGPTGYSFLNFIFTNTAGTPGDCFHAKNSSGISWRARNCSMSGFSHGIEATYSTDYTFDTFVLEDCEIKNSLVHGIIQSGLTILLGCNIHNNGTHGVVMDNADNAAGPSIFAADTVIASNTGHGLYYSGMNGYSLPVLVNCNIVSNGTDGINIFNNNPASIVMRNSILDSNTGYAVNFSNSAVENAFYAFKANAFYNNGSGTYHNLVGDATDITLTADPFTAVATPNYVLNTNSGGGLACTGVGVPSTVPGATGTSTGLSLGALQPAAAAASGGVILTDMSGGMRN